MGKKKNNFKKVVPVAMAAVMACGGLLGASAFFTDQAHLDGTAAMGTLNMRVTDMTDLDGDYNVWSVENNEMKEGTSKVAAAHDASKGTTGIAVADQIATTAGDQTSHDIINPGDSGLLQFKVENSAQKTMKTAAKFTVTVTLADDAKQADGTTSASLAADPDADAYTLEGVGTPFVAVDGNKMTLTYYKELDALSGDKESEDSDHSAGLTNSAIYAIEAKFNRLAQNKFQGASVDVKTDIYAIQGRKTAGTWYSVAADDGKDYTTDTTKVTAATGDWSQIASFEKVIKTGEDSTTGAVTQ